MALLSFPRVFRFSEVAGPEKAKNLAGQSSPPDSDPLTMPSLKENNLGLSTQFVTNANRHLRDLTRDVVVSVEGRGD
jgi:hypothetical protein